MMIVIQKLYIRLLTFIGLEFLGLVICYAPAAIPVPEGFVIWILFPIVGIVGIGIAGRQCVQRMGIFRLLVIFVSTLILEIVFWAVFLWAIFMLSGVVQLEMYEMIVVTAPMLTLWTLACLMILALWPFHAVRNVESPR